jgi:23S rRNA (uracil1939-C5)-methyltransferase
LGAVTLPSDSYPPEYDASDSYQRDSFESTQPVQKGDVLTLEVEGLGDNGDGLCRVQNYVVWVPGALPGERVVVEVIAADRKNGRATLTEFEEKSPHRVTPPCRHFGECGGCQTQHLDYAEQLVFKTKSVASVLKYALDCEEVPVHPCIGPEEPWGTRSRIALQVTDRHGQLQGGLFRRRSRELVEIEECPVSDPKGFEVAQAAVEAFRGIGVEAWDYRTDGGTVRTALVRANAKGDSELTIIVRRRVDSEVREFRKADTGAVSTFLNINDAGRERLIGWQTSHLAGAKGFESEVAGKRLTLSPAAWLRTSQFAIQKMAELVKELVAPIPGVAVADLYSGSGTFALSVADDFDKVFGIEEHPRAVQDAVASAKANGLTNVLFREGQVERHLPDLQGKNIYAVIMDPPPEGCGRFVINVLAKVVRPERLIYVSQNPTSFAGEAAVLEDRGFRLTAVHPIDPAPHTSAIELVALFESSIQGGKRRSSIAQARRLLDRIRRDED